MPRNYYLTFIPTRIACYKKNLNYLLYNLGRDNLVERFKVKGGALRRLVGCLNNVFICYSFNFPPEHSTPRT